MLLWRVSRGIRIIIFAFTGIIRILIHIIVRYGLMRRRDTSYYVVLSPETANG